jgi:hypothetical protein
VNAHGEARIETAEPGRRGGSRVYAALAIAFLALTGLLALLRGDEISAALRDFPLWAAAGAVFAQFLWLNCRGEAWRISLNAVEGTNVPRESCNSANAIAFLFGTLQSAATVPVRAIGIRRLEPDRTPKLEPTLVADAPVLALESTLMGLVLLVAALTTPGLPTWGAVALLVGAGGILTALVVWRERLHDRGLAHGLRVIEDHNRRLKLLGLCTVMILLALARSWLVLTGFGLPDGFASTALFVGALGVLGALPIGPTSSPAAALAVFGAGDATAAAAAGFAMLTTSVAAIGLYGGLWLGILALRGRSPISSLRAPRPDPAGADV